MQCNKCGLPLLGDEIFCPQCGIRIQRAALNEEPLPAPGNEPAIVEAVDVPLEAMPAAPPDTLAEPAPAPAIRAPRSRLVGPLGLGILAGCLTMLILGLGALGVMQGLRLRSGKLNAEAAQHYARGIEYMDKGQHELAAAEFEYALRLEPNYAEAQQKLLEARAALKPTTDTRSDPSALLAAGRAAYDAGSWEEAITHIETLQTRDPSYEEDAARQLLAKAYANSGLKLVNEDRLEEAIRRFDQSLALMPDNPDVQLQRRLASLYQTGSNNLGLDWGLAIQSFQAVYSLKPDYKDVVQKLPRAYIGAGDAAVERSAWCDAIPYYQAALELASDSDVATKRDEAVRRCSAPSGTPVPPGTYIGTFGGTEDIRQRTTSWTKVHGRVVNAKGEGVPNCPVRISAYDWSVVHTTDGTGYYAFEFLTNEVTFTVRLAELPSTPVDIGGKFGYAGIANFTEQP
ncbi:MAG: tetratricopeptide repeat protein [Anaerolineae bacterium]